MKRVKRSITFKVELLDTIGEGSGFEETTTAGILTTEATTSVLETTSDIEITSDEKTTSITTSPNFETLAEQDETSRSENNSETIFTTNQPEISTKILDLDTTANSLIEETTNTEFFEVTNTETDDFIGTTNTELLTEATNTEITNTLTTNMVVVDEAPSNKVFTWVAGSVGVAALAGTVVTLALVFGKTALSFTFFGKSFAINFGNLFGTSAQSYIV